MANRTVLISGAGIAGPALAYWLNKAGYETTLVERAPAIRNGGYVIDFWGLGYDIAERMGLLEDIKRIGYRVREVQIVGDRGQRLAGFGTKVFEELTDGRFVTVARSGLSRLLFEKVRNGTDVLFDDEIVELEEQNDAIRVRFRRSCERRFDLVIGADGLHSQVRDLAFGSQERFEKKLGYGVAAFEVQGYRPRDEDVYLMYGQPGRMIGRFSQHDDRTFFLFVFATECQSMPTSSDLQKVMLRKIYCASKWEGPAIMDELNRANELYFDSVSQIRMDRWWRGRVALVGDAAFCVSLLAGQGSALAMISAYVLAGELLKADGRYDVAFAEYESLLCDYIRSKQRGAERFAAAFAPKTAWGMWFRNSVISALAIPGLGRFIVGRDIVDTVQLPSYRWPS
ncbi:MAG TPA: FAD-binding domain [Rhizomicrobium sp.]|jgi:2-polyprenyl-6-methoxyphenol hydroxylase-like FAD-dependent oxidoreductase